MTSRRRRPAAPRVLGAAIVVAGALAVRELAPPRPGEVPQLVDWDRVRTRAVRSTGDRPTYLVFSADDLAQRYDAIARQMRPWMAEVLGEELEIEFPPFRVLDRRGWVEVNIELFRSLMEPVLK